MTSCRPSRSFGLNRAARGLALAGLLATALPSWALDLVQAYELALSQDAQVRMARAAAEAGRERVPQARAQMLPSLGAQASRNRNNLDTTAPDINGQAATVNAVYRSENDTLSLRQPLYRPGLWAQYRQAGYQAQDVEAQYQIERQNVATRVSQLYFQALLSADQLDVLKSQQAAYTVQLDAATRALAAGLGTRTDVDDARARLDMAYAQELELRQGLESARRELSLMINQPVGELARLDPQRLKLDGPNPDSADAWLQRAEAASPELAALRARLESAREEVAKAQSGHLPTLDAVAQLSRSVSENVTRVNTTYLQRQVGVQLNVPLFQGGYVQSQVREALARVDMAEQQLESVRRDLATRVLREYRGVSEGVLKVQALEQAVRSGEQLVTSNQRSFQAGVRTRVDILNSEQQLAGTRRDLAQARYVYLVSKVRLAALAGEAVDTVIADVSGVLR